MPNYKCPYCDTEIEQVTYSCDTCGTEYGKACIDDNGNFTDLDCDGSDTNDCYNYEYQCSECERAIREEDLIEIDENEENEDETELKQFNEDGKEIKEEKKEEKLEDLINVYHGNLYSRIEEEAVICADCQQVNCIDKTELAEGRADCVKCGQPLLKKEMVIMNI